MGPFLAASPLRGPKLPSNTALQASSPHALHPSSRVKCKRPHENRQVLDRLLGFASVPVRPGKRKRRRRRSRVFAQEGAGGELPRVAACRRLSRDSTGRQFLGCVIATVLRRLVLNVSVPKMDAREKPWSLHVFTLQFQQNCVYTCLREKPTSKPCLGFGCFSRTTRRLPVDFFSMPQRPHDVFKCCCQLGLPTP